jgi:biotin carboxyl carrier protein
MYTVALKEKTYTVDFNKDNGKEGLINNQAFSFSLDSENKNRFQLTYKDKTYKVVVIDYQAEKNIVVLKINNDKVTMNVSNDLDLLLKEMGMDMASSQKINEIKAPMPGLVLDILVEPGQEVHQGDTILVLEAMKMENNIKTPVDAVVKEVRCEKSKAIDKNDILIVFE